MNELASSSRLPTLDAPRRNNFFYGKLLDELHLRMEPDYANGKRWLLNRLALGSGVLCGLQVEKDEDKLLVSSGVVIDHPGREIIVETARTVDPWIVTGEDGCTRELPRDHAEPVTAHLVLCYRECLAEFQPALVSDCQPEPACAAGTIVERFALRVVEGEARRPCPAWARTSATRSTTLAMRQPSARHCAICDRRSGAASPRRIRVSSLPASSS